jgi:hypothetical protein
MKISGILVLFQICKIPLLSVIYYKPYTVPPLFLPRCLTQICTAAVGKTVKVKPFAWPVNVLRSGSSNI